MTILQQITLRCPVCDTRFESLVAKVTKLPGGRRSGFPERPMARRQSERPEEWLP